MNSSINQSEKLNEVLVVAGAMAHINNRLVVKGAIAHIDDMLEEGRLSDLVRKIRSTSGRAIPTRVVFPITGAAIGGSVGYTVGMPATGIMAGAAAGGILAKVTSPEAKEKYQEYKRKYQNFKDSAKFYARMPGYIKSQLLNPQKKSSPAEIKSFLDNLPSRKELPPPLIHHQLLIRLQHQGHHQKKSSPAEIKSFLDNLPSRKELPPPLIQKTESPPKEKEDRRRTRFTDFYWREVSNIGKNRKESELLSFRNFLVEWGEKEHWLQGEKYRKERSSITGRTVYPTKRALKVASRGATVGALAGGTAGALAGATIGTEILPGVGTAIGAAIGGVGGAAYGARKATKFSLNRWGAKPLYTTKYAKTRAGVGGGIGATLGSIAGGTVGASVGGVPGAAIGSTIGGVLGGVAGARKGWKMGIEKAKHKSAVKLAVGEIKARAEYTRKKREVMGYSKEETRRVEKILRQLGHKKRPWEK